MSGVDWTIVDQLFHAALEQPEDTRPQFLFAQCGADTALRLAVERLLRAHNSAGSFLNTAAADEAVRANGFDTGSIGDSIGPYRIIREIGRGGMGAVYLAERADEQFRKVVAIKVIKRGMDTDAVLKRFQEERQILADLEHANIARLLDGGATSDGRPYLVMEFVDGDPLDRYCDDRQLDVDKRLALFLHVCAAVSYAHQRLVIHCDIKPSNVVVTKDGVPKLLDFGIARLIRPDTAETNHALFGARGMTPEYASPEQLQSLRVDALSDVYSLGMLLCELLVGRLPFAFETRTPEEVAAVVTTKDPMTPSSLLDGEARRQVRGDLDTIVLTALARDRSRRYSSVERLADDVRAHLEGRPIDVRRERVYRARKFIRRNRVAIGAATLVAATLVAGIAATTWEARRADAQSEAARAVTAFLQDDLLTQASTRAQANGNATADPNLTVRTALDRAAARIEGKFTNQPRVEAGIRRTIAQTYLNLGVYADAQKHLERAIALFRTLDGAAGRETLQAMQLLGFVLHMEGKNGPAEAILTSVLEEQQRQFGPDSAPVNETLNDLASTISSMGRRHDAKILHARVVDISRRLYGEDHPETLVALNNLLTDYLNEAAYAEADALGQRVVAIKRRVLGAEHPSTLLTVNTLAVVYRNEGKYGDAETLLRETLQIRRRVTGEGSPDTLASMNSLAEAYRREGKSADAERLFSQVLTSRRRVLGPTHPNTLAVLLPLARLKLDAGQFGDAKTISDEAVRGYEQTRSDTWQRYYALSLLATSLAAEAKYVEAGQLLTSAYDGLVRKRTSISAENLWVLDEVKRSITRLHELRGKPDRAR